MTPDAQLPKTSSEPSLDAEPARPTNPARIRWAVLLARIYEVLPLLCPVCGGPMKILAFLTDPLVVTAILVHLELPHQPPLISSARGPPQGDFLLRSDPDLRAHRGRARTRIRLRPIGARRVRPRSVPPPAVCPDKLSQSATSTRPSQHPRVPLRHPGTDRPAHDHRVLPDSRTPVCASHPTRPPASPPPR